MIATTAASIARKRNWINSNGLCRRMCIDETARTSPHTAITILFTASSTIDSMELWKHDASSNPIQASLAQCLLGNLIYRYLFLAAKYVAHFASYIAVNSSSTNVWIRVFNREIWQFICQKKADELKCKCCYIHSVCAHMPHTNSSKMKHEHHRQQHARTGRAHHWRNQQFTCNISVFDFSSIPVSRASYMRRSEKQRDAANFGQRWAKTDLGLEMVRRNCNLPSWIDCRNWNKIAGFATATRNWIASHAQERRHAIAFNWYFFLLS